MKYDDMSNTRLQRTDSNVNSTNIMAISVLLTCSKVQQQQKQKFRQKWIWNPPAVHLKIDYVNLFLKKKALLSQNILSHAFRQTRCLSVKLQAWTSALRFSWKHPLLNVFRVLCYFQLTVLMQRILKHRYNNGRMEIFTNHCRVPEITNIVRVKTR